VGELPLRIRMLFCLLLPIVNGMTLGSPSDAIPKYSELLRFYDLALSRVVSKQGRVDYSNLQSERILLDRFVDGIASIPLKRMSKPEQLAFWINAYNALTLRIIIDHYPIRPGIISNPMYPSNSIRQIPGAWNKIKFRIAGQLLTLDNIEHEIIRKDFKDPRVHMALVCAAIGCPRLRYEAFRGHRLEDQLNDQSREFFRDPKKFRIDRSKREVIISPILKWYGKDFLSGHWNSGQHRFKKHPSATRAVLRFATSFLPPEDRLYLESREFRIRYSTYDWSLNEIQIPSPKNTQKNYK